MFFFSKFASRPESQYGSSLPSEYLMQRWEDTVTAGTVQSMRPGYRVSPQNLSETSVKGIRCLCGRHDNRQLWISNYVVVQMDLIRESYQIRKQMQEQSILSHTHNLSWKIDMKNEFQCVELMSFVYLSCPLGQFFNYAPGAMLQRRSVGSFRSSLSYNLKPSMLLPSIVYIINVISTNSIGSHPC